MPQIAKLAIQSNLPQLDRLFDYSVPDHLKASVEIGSRVKVHFGKSKRLIDGYVIELTENSDYRGKLSAIEEVLGDRPVLLPEIFRLCQELSERSASTLGEVVKLAIPAHMPRAFERHVAMELEPKDKLSACQTNFDMEFTSNARRAGNRSFILSEPRSRQIQIGELKVEAPSWAALFVAIAVENLSQSKSTIILVPDYREHEVILSCLASLGLAAHVCNYSQDLPKSKQYEAFLRALDPTPRIILGSRLAALAPAFELGSILMFDESDQSFWDRSAPYLGTRDVALVRQSIQNCSLLFASHSISTDIRRLLESEFLKDITLNFPNPRLAVSEPGFRVDSSAYSAIKDGLKEGPVLVQVSSVGDSTALYCTGCDEVARCTSCSGPIWLDTSSNRKCRWCNSFQMSTPCTCGSTNFRPGRAGSSRTASELGKAFPSARVIESIGEKRLIRVKREKALVVATAGAEPYVDGGYSAVVLLDAKVLLSRQSLRAEEDAVRIWSNAIAKGSASSRSVLVGVSGLLAQSFSLWDHGKISAVELTARKELRLPPALRLGSITADQEMVKLFGEKLSGNSPVQTIGPAPVGEGLWRLLFKYSYAEGLALAQMLKSMAAKVSAGNSRIMRSGRSGRAITIKMNDPEVI